MRKQPFDLSFIIPFYKGEKYIIKLIRSILISKDASQCELAFQIIIIIDSPETELTALNDQLANNFGDALNSGIIQVYKNEINLGVANTRNYGIKLAQGAYCVFIDQDDEISVEYFKKIKPYLYESDFILVNGYFIDVLNHFKYRIYYLAPSVSIETLISDDYIRSPGQVIISKEFLKNVHFPAPKKFYGADDRFFWIAVFLVNKQIKFKYIKSPIFICNLHENNYSNDSRNLVYSCLDLWELLLQQYTFEGRLKELVERNILLQRFLLESFKLKHHKFKALVEFIKYKFSLNKVFRFGMKKMRLFIKSA